MQVHNSVWHIPLLKRFVARGFKENAVFTFKYDESTTQQVNKQYDEFIQYWSKKHKCIKISHCGTIMVDHCPAEKLMNIFFNL